MLLTLTQNISSRINQLSQEERSKKVLVNVLSSFGVKIFSMVITLTLVPVSLKYTDKDTYGVWLTLSSVITWFNLFDLGLSNGLTNKLAASFALGDQKKARMYLSTTYGFLFVIVLFCALCFFVANNFINWNAVFNTTINREELRTAVTVTFLSFCSTFALKPLNDLLKAKQKHFIQSIIQVSGNLVALLSIYFWGSHASSKFLFLCFALGFSYPASLLLASIIFYAGSFKNLLPRLDKFSRRCLKEIFGLSAKFFVIQLSVIMILTSNNFLISHFVDNQNVTYYNIAYRLFSIVSVFQIMIMTPLWPAFTDAFTLKDYGWIQRTIAKSQKLGLLLCIPLLLMLAFCTKIYALWVGPSIHIPQNVNILLALFIAIWLFKEPYVSFINGAGKLNLQTAYSVVTIVLQIPLAYFLSKICHLGISGILLTNIFWIALALILWKTQYNMIIHKRTERKLWN